MKIQRRAVAGGNRPVNPESGVALILALLSLLIISTLAAGLMFTTQNEIWTTSNYRAVTQARYAAEAGVQRAIWFISNQWTVPSSLATASTFNTADFPLTYCSGGNCTSSSRPFCASNPTSNCVVMAPTNGVSGLMDTYSNINSATDTNFNNLVNNANGNNTQFSNVVGTPKFTVAVQLLSAQQSSGLWATSWKIVSVGTVNGLSKNASVQAVATIENKLSSTTTTTSSPVQNFQYGMFANSSGCNAITLSGGSNSNSFNSATSGGSSSPSLTYAGSIATLGNVYMHNSAMVYGNIYAPNYNLGNPSAGYSYCATYCPWNSLYYPYGVSGGANYWNAVGSTSGIGESNVQACSAAWPYAVNMDNSGGTGFGCTQSGNSSSCVDQVAKLPSTFTATTYPTATLPSTPVNNTAVCSANTACAGNYGTGSYTFTPSNNSYGQVTLGSNDDFYFSAGTYYFDTLTITGSARIHLSSAPVSIYILNASNQSIPLNFTGGQQTNQGGIPNNLTFIYNGTDEVHVGNISSNAVFGTIYAPNAPVVFDGNGNVYGAVVGSTISITGGGNMYYDQNAANLTPNVYTGSSTTPTLTAFHIDEFSWSAY